MEWIKIDDGGVIPIIKKVDLLVVGGGIIGLPIAEMASKRNHKVMIIEAGTFLGYEVTKWQRPWFRWVQENEELARKWFHIDEMSGNNFKEETILPIHMGKFKISVEDRLLDSGVEILYGSTPIGCFKKGDHWVISIGNKSGRQCIFAKEIIDTTEKRIIERLLSDEGQLVNSYLAEDKESRTRKLIVHRTMEFTKVHNNYQSKYTLPENLGLEGNLINIYPGAYDTTHVFVDIPVVVYTKEQPSIREDMRIEWLAREKSLEVASYLVGKIEEFREAIIGFGSLQVMSERDFDPLKGLKEGVELGEKLLEGIKVKENPNIWYTNDIELYDFHTPSEDFKSHVLESAVEYRDENEFSKIHNFPTVSAKIKQIPILAETDVLVVGGGTSGIAAAWMAAGEGANVGLVEMNAALGGTSTIGGVNKYWFGNQNAITEEIDSRVAKWSKKVGYPQEFYIWSKDDVWSIEVKSYVLLELCMEMGIEIFPNSTVIGTLTNKNSLLGVVLATPYGIAGVTGKVTVDATGDGDVAAFAGAQYVYGNQRDAMTMWASLAQYTSPGETQNNFTTTVDVGDVFDYTRKILEGRRCGGVLYDHGSYLAPRETRHILGDITMDLRDQLLMRKYPDTIAVCYSNHDPKGRSTSDLIYFGILPPHLEIHIPYRVLLPKGLEQLLVTGKAISCTHDALPAVRMQKDLHQQGGAVGMAAALAAMKGISPRMLPIEILQERLIEQGIIPAKALESDTKEQDYSYKELIDRLDGAEPFEWLEMGWTERAEDISPIILLCTAESYEVVPYLLDAFDKTQGEKQLLLAKLLVWHGREEGLETVISEIRRGWERELHLPRRKGSIRFTTILPDHGVMTETNYLINSLSRVHSKRVMVIYEELVKRIRDSHRDYLDQRAGIFNYIESVAYAAERLLFREFTPLLHELLRLPELQRRIRTSELDLDPLGERLSYLRLCLARALARCGNKEGLFILAEFIQDNRMVLAKSAYGELMTLTGKDYGLDYYSWMYELYSL